jgi:nitrogen fixation/metabolism regulation signal transduction histidine kinase
MSDEKPQTRPRYKRSFKNYLLDPHFQLKYTGLLVGIAIVLSAGLGVLLWRAGKELGEQSQVAVQQGAETVEQGQKTIERGKEVIVQSDKVNQVVTSTMETCYADSPELLESFRKDAGKDQERLKQEQQKLEDDAQFLKNRAASLLQQKTDLENRQAKLGMALLLALVVLVLGIGIAGIVFTHKIAGPIFKMKRLLRQVGEGKLVVRERLRKGDELVHFFEVFEQMVETLRTHQQEEIDKIDKILERLESSEGYRDKKGDGIAELKALRNEMQARLEP